MTIILSALCGAIAFLLYGILRTLGAIHEVLASIYVYDNMEGERAQRNKQMEAAHDVLGGKSILYRRPTSAVNELAELRASMDMDFDEIAHKISRKQKDRK